MRGPGCGLWWESADTARARCALAIHEGDEFCGVVLVVFSGLTIGDEDRVERVDDARAGAARAGARPCTRSLSRRRRPTRSRRLTSDTTIIAQLRFVNNSPRTITRSPATSRRWPAKNACSRSSTTRCARTNSRCTCSPSCRCATMPPRRAAHRRGADPPAHAGVRRALFARISRRRGAQRQDAGDRSLGDPRAAGMDAAQSRPLDGCQDGVLGEPLGPVGGASGFPRVPGECASTSPACRRRRCASRSPSSMPVSRRRSSRNSRARSPNAAAKSPSTTPARARAASTSCAK